VTDSTSDLDTKWLEQYDIRVIPAFVNFGEESFADDGVAITRQEFYIRLKEASELPTTSSPPPGIAESTFRELLADADHIIALTVAANLSGIHNGMVLAAQNVSPDKITVVDSGSLTMGLGWMVLAAAEAAQKGASLEEILAIIEDTRKRTKIYAALDTLENLRRSGRVSWASAAIGSLLRIKPIIGVKDGNVEPASRVRTFKKAVEEIVRLAESHAPLVRLAVLHSNAPDRAKELHYLLKSVAPADDTVTADVTTAIGTHVGPGAVGIAFVEANSS
jgi:DegV family protein with EDD domain